MARVEHAVDISIPGHIYDVGDVEDELTEMAGRLSDFSGAGFGNRDVGWYFKTPKQAREFAKKVKRRFKRVTIETYTSEC